MGHENFDLRPECQVLYVNKAEDGTATGVTYVAANGQEYFQPADVVLMCGYAIWNVHLLLVSGLGKPYDPETRTGVVGRNYAYQTIGSVSVFFDETIRTNPFMGAGALGTVIDDYNGDNFDHSGLGFVGGGYIAATQYHGRPIQYNPTPSDVPNWGGQWKRAVRDYYLRHAGVVCHGSSASTHENYLDLDPTYRDAYGRPLLRMTFDFPQNDRDMMKYVVSQAERICRGMRHAIKVETSNRAADDQAYSVVPYQTTHNTGGAVIGTDPQTSVVNRFGQMWDHPNVFVFGACLFPQNHGYNPTGTVLGLCYWTLDAIKNRYLPNPGPLMEA